MTMKLTTGIATALASGETRKTAGRRGSRMGSEARVAAHCTRPHCRRCRRQPPASPTVAEPT